ncbi:MAG TPA: glycerol-3-phosphate acyltransferase [Anaerolineae bacterium]|nr:glycerol-3-phosphate acyltransferase [Anaerolineae bacterium]HID85094.1 glycerol-3-phosphate acyltransferase [Anaerolineales bacterium]HIQ09877.1 glycerol-3-phosphate acyltransferase [Anaerolineaceae bacterium]
MPCWWGAGRWGDIRRYGDGNPGAYNVFRAGGRVSGATASGLEVLKGLVLIALACRHVPVAVCPWAAWAAVAGHAFSPWLGFRGGKAIAVSLGSGWRCCRAFRLSGRWRRPSSFGWRWSGLMPGW